jgi:enterochelin esterase family protein
MNTSLFFRRFGCRVLGGCILILPLSAGKAQEKYKEPDFPVPPEAVAKEGVTAGKIERFQWKSTGVYPGTIRNVSIYVPAQYKPDGSAALMVFQDGHSYVNPKGEFKTTIIFDNLIAAGQMPVTVGVFIDPGVFADSLPEETNWQVLNKMKSNRSVEYDTPNGDYAKFLEKEILPEVTKRYSFSAEPDKHAICGISSGGICAFTAAWERPDLFRKVLSHVGSFTNIRGGYHYPFLLRKTPPKPLRVFLQDGAHDLNNIHGNWVLANQMMADSLAFAKYDSKFVTDERGAHSGKHGGSILPDSLRWLWRNP